MYENPETNTQGIDLSPLNGKVVQEVTTQLAALKDSSLHYKLYEEFGDEQGLYRGLLIRSLTDEGAASELLIDLGKKRGFKVFYINGTTRFGREVKDADFDLVQEAVVMPEIGTETTYFSLDDIEDTYDIPALEDIKAFIEFHREQSESRHYEPRRSRVAQGLEGLVKFIKR